MTTRNIWKDKVCVVTGAASGIGRALAVALAGRGARLALSDTQEAGLAETVSLCGEAAEVHSQRLDCGDRAAVLAYPEQVVGHFGTVNTVINNAGVNLTADALDQSVEDLEWVLQIDLYGVIWSTQAFLPHLVASGDGHLVNISSVFGLIGVPGQSAYNAAKFGVRGYTEAIAMEMALEGHPVTVHCVHPGGVATNIVRHGRVAGRNNHEKLSRTFDKMARTSPEAAARAIIRGVEKGTRRILVGKDAHIIHTLSNALGSGYQALVKRSSVKMRPRRR